LELGVWTKVDGEMGVGVGGTLVLVARLVLDPSVLRMLAGSCGAFFRVTVLCPVFKFELEAEWVTRGDVEDTALNLEDPDSGAVEVGVEGSGWTPPLPTPVPARPDATTDAGAAPGGKLPLLVKLPSRARLAQANGDVMTPP